MIGIRLKEGDEVVGMEILSQDSCILTVSEAGYGKRTPESEYRVQSRGGKGLINLRLTPKTGSVAGIRQVFDDDDVMVMSDQGKLVRLRVADISRIGRNTQGVRLINMEDDQRLVGVVRVEEDNGRSSDNLNQFASPEDQDEALPPESDTEFEE